MDVSENRKERECSVKIAIFSMSMNKGGAERVISALCNYGAKHGYNMHIVTCLQGESQYELDTRVKKHKGFISLEKYRAESKVATLPRLCTMYVKCMQSIKHLFKLISSKYSFFLISLTH